MSAQSASEVALLSEAALPKMPSPEDYELEYIYWPWGQLIASTIDWVVDSAPHSGYIVDYMCGTGYLLHQISKQRPDLRLAGCTLEPRSYVEYAHCQYPDIQVTYEDVFDFHPDEQADLIICTGALHHLPRSRQGRFLSKVASELKKDGILLLGEELIRDYATEVERRLAVIEMWQHLARHVVLSSAPDPVLKAAMDILSNDLLEQGEYKTSLKYLEAMLACCFNIISISQTWPAEPAAYGDFLYICRGRENNQFSNFI
jgi:hypothetical protein